MYIEVYEGVMEGKSHEKGLNEDEQRLLSDVHQ